MIGFTLEGLRQSQNSFVTNEDPQNQNVSLQFTPLATWLLNNVPVWFNIRA